VANNTGYGGYVLSYQHLELANDSIPRVNPYRLILNQPSYKSNISLTAGMRGLGIGLLSSIAVAGVVFVSTKEDSWDRLLVVFLPMITYPIASSFATGTGAEKAIKRSTPEEYRVYSGAFPSAMLVTLGVQAVSVTLTALTEQQVFLIGVLASTFIGGNAGAKNHIKTMTRYADEWDEGVEYLRVNPGANIAIESLVNKNNDFNPVDTVTVNPYQNLIQNKGYSNKIVGRTIKTGALTGIITSTILLAMSEGSNFRNGSKRFVDYDFNPSFLGATIFGTFATSGAFSYSIKRYTPVPPILRHNANLHTVLATGGTFGALYYASELTDSPIPGLASLVIAPVAGALVGMHSHKKNLEYSSSSWNLKQSDSWLKPNMIPESSIGLELVPDLSDPTIDMDVGSIRKSVVPVVKMTWRF
jgi:hypothetical protein